VRILTLIFHGIFSPPLAKIFDRKFTFYHSFSAENCSASLEGKNFQLLFDLSLTARKNNETTFSVAKDVKERAVFSA
jgi:hypothetical protein